MGHRVARRGPKGAAWLPVRLVAVALLLVVAGCTVVGVEPTGQASPSTQPDAIAGGIANPTSPGIAGRIALAPTVPETVTPAPTPTSKPTPNLPAIPPGAVPILYYHRVQAPPPDWATWSREQRKAFLAYTVSPAAFEAQLDWLVDHGYKTILPRDLAAHWDKGKKLPKRPVIITFDDGTRDWITAALPALQKRGLVAEFYVSVQNVEVNAISWDDIRTLAAAGNGIGSHHVNHVQLAMLGAGRPPASTAVMWNEVSRSRAIIAREVGVAPDSLAYVGGGFDATLQRLVRKAGYSTARSILRGIVQAKSDRYALRVVRIGPRDDVDKIATSALAPGLPTFTARMHGVSDLP